MKEIYFYEIHVLDSPNILSIMTWSKVVMYPKNENPMKSPSEPPRDPSNPMPSRM